MSTTFRQAAYLFSLVEKGNPADSVVVAIPTVGQAVVFEGVEAATGELAKRFTPITDPLRVRRQVELHKNTFFEVAESKFFSHSSGVEVVEILAFLGGSRAPISVNFLVRRKVGGLALYTRPNIAQSVGDALAEEERATWTRPLQQIPKKPGAKP
ncbi:hypothetical protein NJG16_01185 [Stenotrophomonas maltophilia]|uniref:hypothetical protein n=1 Tax=Stenotrophomonas lactitubi TaxID=2045214 RepID=UPI00203D7C33|nr:hypothetical protein [Stenotrophomonas lactitubi]MCO7468679.1 hypothetical protein [Stenotrophomonas maltophilia]